MYWILKALWVQASGADQSMLFNSFSFLLFFPVVCLLYFWLSKQKSRLILLLVSSCFFYGFFIPQYLLILFLVIGIDFYAGKKIETTTNEKKRKLFLTLSLVANFSILFFFKYYNFTVENINHIIGFFHWNLSISALKIILPIGLSFHTFQSMSYVFEVYKKRFPAEKSILHYSVYVLYFPQLVAGPIERPQNIFPQLHQFHPFDYERCVAGLYLVTQGLFKKSVIADSLAPLANTIFSHPLSFGLVPTLSGVIAFTFQIYCDFSGYSDIARGISKILGIELMINFNKPYFANSMSDFWRRWHISLSTWFRDYLYIPLGGNRTSRSRTFFNLMLVFILSGFWHGANWTFLSWGALHGLFLILELSILKNMKFDHWPKVFSRIYVLILVSTTWVFFRANSMDDVLGIFSSVFRSPYLGFDLIKKYQMIEALILILFLVMFEFLDSKKNIHEWVRSLFWIPRWTIYWTVAIIFLFAAQFTGNQFIYFQF